MMPDVVAWRRPVSRRFRSAPTRRDCPTGKAGFRSEARWAKVAGLPGEVIVALGREGRDQVAIDADQYPHTAAMAARLQTSAAKEAYRRRKAIVEPPNGWIKAVLGFRQFSLRGLKKVQAEWQLVCLALNLRRMACLG